MVNPVLDFTTVLPQRETVLLSAGEYQINEADDLPFAGREEVSRLEAVCTHVENKANAHAARLNAVSATLAMVERDGLEAVAARWQEAEAMRAEQADANADVAALDVALSAVTGAGKVPNKDLINRMIAARKKAITIGQKLADMPQCEPKPADEMYAELMRLMEMPGVSQAESEMYERARRRLAIIVLRHPDGTPVTDDELQAADPADIDAVLSTFLALKQRGTRRERKLLVVQQWFRETARPQNLSISPTPSPSSKAPTRSRTRKTGS